MISEVDFVSPCPVEGCINRTPIRWRHSNCGGYEKLTNQGKIYCLKCGADWLITDQKFSCGEHDSRKASFKQVCHILSVMSLFDTKSQQFFSSLMPKVLEQFKIAGKF